MSEFKPMLSGKPKLDKDGKMILNFPVLASAKLDGIRASVIDGKLRTRTLKEVQNRHVFELLSKPEYEGLDGELIVGSPTAEDVYRTTVSGVMSRDGEPEFVYWVFDLHNLDLPYDARYERLVDKLLPESTRVLPQRQINSLEELESFEADMLAKGYEGVIVRDPKALYKYGRATATKGELLKVKRFSDSEAVILSVHEEMFNGNEATTNALGRTERSSHKENKTGKARMGFLQVRDIHTGVKFSVGTGFDDDDRAWFWDPANRPDGMYIKYKFFAIGVKEKPRHPVYQGLRDPTDLPEVGV